MAKLLRLFLAGFARISIFLCPEMRILGEYEVSILRMAWLDDRGPFLFMAFRALFLYLLLLFLLLFAWDVFLQVEVYEIVGLLILGSLAGYGTLKRWDIHLSLGFDARQRLLNLGIGELAAFTGV